MDENDEIDLDAEMDFEPHFRVVMMQFPPEDFIFSRSTLPRTGHVAVKYKSSMLVWGGYKCDVNRQPIYMSTATLWTYDTVVEKWNCLKTKEENAPIGLSGACALVHNDMLYIFGGFCDEMKSNSGNTNEIYALDLIELVWHNYKCHGPRPIPCDKMVGWTHNGGLYFFGGFGVPPSNTGSEETRPCAFCYDDSDVWSTRRGWNNQLVMFDTIAKKWKWPSCKGAPPIPRAAHASAKVGNKVFIFGGRNTTTRMNDLHCLDLESMKWSGRLQMKGTVPQGRSWHTFTPISDNHIVLYGGFTNQREALSKFCDCWILELTTLSWTKVSLPHDQPRMWHTACSGDPGEVMIFGGCTGNILNPILPKEAGDVITLWFSPKSLLRLSLDAAVDHKEKLEILWPSLPCALQNILWIKSKSDIYQQTFTD